MKQLILVAAVFTLRILIYNGQAIAATVYIHPALAGYDNTKTAKNNRAQPATHKLKNGGMKMKIKLAQ